MPVGVSVGRSRSNNDKAKKRRASGRSYPDAKRGRTAHPYVTNADALRRGW